MIFPSGESHGRWLVATDHTAVDWTTEEGLHQTRRAVELKPGTWHRCRLRVGAHVIEAWIDDEKVIGFDTRTHPLKPDWDQWRADAGDADLVFFSVQTAAALRNIRFRRLGPPVAFRGKTLMIEAERAQAIVEPFRAEPDATASGGWFVWEPEDAREGNHTPEARAVFLVEVSRQATVYLWGRVRSPVLDSDSFYVGVAPGRVKDALKLHEWHLGVRASWQWRPFAPFGSPDYRADRPIPIPLRAGVHSIVIACREDGACLDRIALTARPAPPE